MLFLARCSKSEILFVVYLYGFPFQQKKASIFALAPDLPPDGLFVFVVEGCRDMCIYAKVNLCWIGVMSSGGSPGIEHVNLT